jgi:hypothetical protein
LQDPTKEKEDEALEVLKKLAQDYAQGLNDKAKMEQEKKLFDFCF